MTSTLTILALLLTTLLGIERRRVPVPLEQESVLFLEGGSTIRDWSCSTAALQAWMIEGSRDAPSEAGTARGELRVPVGTLDCGDRRMESDLRDALRDQDHPDIAFLLTDWRLIPDGQGFSGVAGGELTLAGETHRVDLTVQAEADRSTGARVVGRTDLRMTSFGIRPPTAFFGLIKARDEVEVRFDLRIDSATVARLQGAQAPLVVAP